MTDSLFVEVLTVDSDEYATEVHACVTMLCGHVENHECHAESEKIAREILEDVAACDKCHACECLDPYCECKQPKYQYIVYCAPRENERGEDKEVFLTLQEARDFAQAEVTVGASFECYIEYRQEGVTYENRWGVEIGCDTIGHYTRTDGVTERMCKYLDSKYLAKAPKFPGYYFDKFALENAFAYRTDSGRMLVYLPRSTWSITCEVK